MEQSCSDVLPALHTCPETVSKFTLPAHRHTPSRSAPAAGRGASRACSAGGTEAPSSRTAGSAAKRVVRKLPFPITSLSLRPSDWKEAPHVPNCHPESPRDPSSMTSKSRALSELAAPTGPQEWAMRAPGWMVGRRMPLLPRRPKCGRGRDVSPAGLFPLWLAAKLPKGGSRNSDGSLLGWASPAGSITQGSEGAGRAAGWEAGPLGLRCPDCRDNLSPRSSHLWSG